MNILTAIGNPAINEELKKNNKFNIISRDILYKEGILEFLEEEKNIDIIILNEELDGKIELDELLNKVNKINNKIKIIILFKDKNKYLNYEILKNNFFKLYESEINFYKLNDFICNIEKIKNELNEENKNNKKIIKEDIKKNKKILKEKNKLKSNNKIKNNKIKKLINNLKNKNSDINIKIELNINIK